MKLTNDAMNLIKKISRKTVAKVGHTIHVTRVMTFLVSRFMKDYCCSKFQFHII